MRMLSRPSAVKPNAPSRPMPVPMSARRSPCPTTILTSAAPFAPSAILLDLNLPGLDGYGVLSHLRSRPATADIPVIMMTMVDEDHIGFSLGAADYFTKPVDIKDLLRTIGEMGLPVRQ